MGFLIVIDLINIVINKILSWCLVVDHIKVIIFSFGFCRICKFLLQCIGFSLLWFVEVLVSLLELLNVLECLLKDWALSCKLEVLLEDLLLGGDFLLSGGALLNGEAIFLLGVYVGVDEIRSCNPDLLWYREEVLELLLWSNIQFLGTGLACLLQFPLGWRLSDLI